MCRRASQRASVENRSMSAPPNEDSAGRMSDNELLTHDADFLEIAAQCQRQGIAFGGILFAPQGTPIGRLIHDVELCLTGMTANEFANRLVHLPLR